MISFAAGTISYYMAGLHPGLRHYTFFVLTLFASVACVESMMMTIASLVPNYLMGIITGAGILVSIKILFNIVFYQKYTHHASFFT